MIAESYDYPFLSHNTFEELLDKFLDSKLVNRRRKTFITVKILKVYKNLQMPQLEMRKNVTGQKNIALRGLGTSTNPILQLIKIDSNLPVCPR